MLKTIEKFLDSKALLKSYCLVCRARASFVSEPRGRALSLPSNRVTGGGVTTSLRLHQKDEERPGEGGEDVGEGGEDLPGGWHVLDEERLQHHVGEALVLEAGEQAGLLEHVGRHHCGGQQSQAWPVVLRVGDDVLEGVG